MRVLHVAETIQGGVGAHLEEIVPRQVAALGEGAVRVIVPESERHFFPRIPAAQTRGFDRPGSRLRNTAALAAAIRREQAAFGADVVHAHSTFAGAAVRLPLLRPRDPRPAIVYCPHGWSFAADRGPRRLYARAERALQPAADAIVTVSRFERDLAVSMGLRGDNLVVLRNGIADVPPVEPVREGFPRDRLNLLFVGRLDRQKGFDILLDAARRVPGAVHLHVVGSSVRELADGAAAAAPPPNMTLHGWQPRDAAAAFIAACDAVVMPSRWEGLPLVALEAMRAGKPILASDRSAMPEVVEDGVTGRLFGIDDGASLAALVGQLSRDDLRRWGAAGRARFERDFTVDRQSREILDLYARIPPRRRERADD